MDDEDKFKPLPERQYIPPARKDIMDKLVDKEGNYHFEYLRDHELLMIKNTLNITSTVREYASKELERRDAVKGAENKDKLIKAVFTKIDRGLNLFELIAKKPKTALLWTGLFAVVVAVSTNVLSALFFKYLNLK